MENNPLRSILFLVFSSITQASGVLGIDRHRLSRLIDGRSQMAADEAAKIAEVTGVATDDVIEAARSVRQARAGPERSKSKVKTSPGGRNTERGKE